MEPYSIILFDGVCNLCNSSVLFVLKRDPRNRFRFAALQSDIGQQLIAQHLPTGEVLPDSIVLIEGGRLYVKSTAALKIARKLPGAWPLLYGFMIFPRFIRDAVYSFIAKNRYRWFGKKDACMVPTPALKSKFL
ncbi:thiol-disulfide oxidoreductase DCC family protein [Chitinophaga skermanii]|nr:thiol-disulfide oxidoreductase DCC family protein [Chitinophaga skermanii]